MKLVEFNWEPTDRQLRQFGWISLVAFPLAARILSGAWGTATIVCAGVGVLLAAIGQFSPQILKPVFIGLSLATFPIGLVVGELSMLLIYYGLFTPMGLLLRLMGRDSLQSKKGSAADTYWTAKQQPRGPESYYRQF